MLRCRNENKNMMHISLTDKINVVRKLAEHRIIARDLRREGGDDLFEHAGKALVEMQELYGETAFVSDWKQIMRLGREEVARLIVSRDDRMSGLRDGSPFLRLWGRKFGQDQDIDFQDEATRHRLWRVARRVAMIEPHTSEATSCKVLTPT
jgi:hypothetical protein